MRTMPCMLVVIGIFLLGLLAAVPAEDLSSTAYDESEGLPVEATPLVSDAAFSGTASLTATVRAFRVRRTTGLDGLVNTHNSNGSDRRYCGPRELVALLCTLVC